jgi:hypothetical protein
MAGTNTSGEDTTGSPLTVATAGTLLDRLLLSDEEPQDKVEPQPKGETPKGEDVDEDEASSEQAEDLDEDDIESETDEEEAEAPPKPKLHRVKDGDKEIEVEESELHAGYLRRQDYTRKTQGAAEERKKYETLNAEGATQRAAYAERLTALDAVLKEQTPPEPDWAKLRTEMKPEEYNATWIAWEQHKRKLATVADAKRKADEAVFADQKKVYEKHVETEEASLLEAIPEWKDKAVRKAEMTKLVSFATSTAGYDPKELSMVTDHRVIKLVRDAMKYHEIVAKRKAAKAQVEKTDKETAPPSGGSPEKKPVSKQARASMRLAKTGSVNDAAAVLLAMPGLIE